MVTQRAQRAEHRGHRERQEAEEKNLRGIPHSEDCVRNDGAGFGAGLNVWAGFQFSLLNNPPRGQAATDEERRKVNCEDRKRNVVEGAVHGEHEGKVRQKNGSASDLLAIAGEGHRVALRERL